MVAPNKQRILAKLHSTLAKKYEDEVPDDLSVLDHLLIAVIQEGTSFPVALAVYKRMITGFHDFNELRVSHRSEIVDYLGEVPDKEIKARRILGILKFVFETTYAFDLESMRKKPLKQAQKQLSKITGANAFTVAAAVQRALGGHAIPVDEAMCAVLKRLEILDEEETLEQARQSLEHLVQKAKGISFALLVSGLVADSKNQEELLLAINPKSKPKPKPVPPSADSKTSAAKTSKSGKSGSKVSSARKAAPKD